MVRIIERSTVQKKELFDKLFTSEGSHVLKKEKNKKFFRDIVPLAVAQIALGKDYRLDGQSWHAVNNYIAQFPITILIDDETGR